MTVKLDEQTWTERIASLVDDLAWRCDKLREDKEEATRVAEFALRHGLTEDALTNLVWVMGLPELYRLQASEQQILLALTKAWAVKEDGGDDLPF